MHVRGPFALNEPAVLQNASASRSSEHENDSASNYTAK